MAATVENDGGVERIPIIDTDVHSAIVPTGNDLARHLPKEVADYIRFRGVPTGLTGERPRQRPFAARTDSFTPSGGQPGSDPVFAAQQLLDEHDIGAAVINDLPGRTCGGKRWPDAYVSHLARAYNDMRAEKWLASDDRWWGSITLAYEIEGAEQEIQRCREMPEYGDRWVGSSRVDLQACKLEYSIVSPK